MDQEVDIRQLAGLLRTKRGKRPLRDLAEEIGGISAATLSRVEQGKLPDLDTFARICRWLNVPADHFLTTRAFERSVPITSPGMSTPEIISVHLRADRELSPETAEALSTMIRLAYEAVVRGKIG